MKAWMVGGALCAALVFAGTVPHQDAAAQIDPGAERPLAGQYRSTMTFLSIDMPGAPPEVAQMMGQIMSNTATYCLTEADIEEGYRAITNRSTRGGEECAYESFSYLGGQIDAVLVCKVDGQSMRMEMSGTGNATSSDITMTMSGDFGMGDGSMRLRSQHERIGECG